MSSAEHVRNVVVIGAAGGVGQHILAQGKQQGLNLTALVRSAEKIRAFENQLRMVIGDALDRNAVAKAVSGQDAVIYAIGVKTIRPTTVFSESTRILLDEMERGRVRRLVCITGVGAGETKGHGGWLYDWVFYPLITRNFYEDKDRQEGLIRQSSVDWIIVRPAPFREGAARGELKVVTKLENVKLTRISRAEVAQFVLEQLHSDRYLRQTPFIGHE